MMQAQPAPPLLQPVEADGSEGKKRRRGAQPAQRRGVRTAVNPYKADGSLAPGWMEGPDGEPVKCTGRARAAALARQAEVAEAQATLGRALSQRGAKVKAAARLAAAGMASDDSDYDVGQEFEPDAAAQPVQQPAKPGRRRGRPPKKNAEGQAVPHAAAGSADGIGGAASVAGMPLPVEMDVLFGCTKCRYAKGGCGSCRDKPVMERPRTLRWKPEAGHAQDGMPEAPTFHPTAEQFTDPMAYINSIRPEAEKAGMACIVPPEGWAPPFALEKGTNGHSMESFRFLIRKQLTSRLCMRLPNTSRNRKQQASGRYGAGKHSAGADVDGTPVAMEEVQENGVEDDEDGDFGFHTMDRSHTLKSFAAYADWAKALHFSDPPPGQRPSLNAQPLKRRKISSYSGPEPTVEEIEAEFWRIVEVADDALDIGSGHNSAALLQVAENLYGQDLDSGHHGSGFPLPPFRQKLLEQHLKKQAAERGPGRDREREGSSGSEREARRQFTPEEVAYSEHPWNINNLPRCKGSVLHYLIGDELITGVMVPWLYVGSCMSAFCWHIEDLSFYSINYLHMGAPKVWYSVPAHASEALEDAVRDALPHLFETAPDLLYQLVTMVSPKQLQARGVPVHRVKHYEGSFVITFPNAYHAGFNTGFNCAEAVNFGPPDWLPWGTDIAEKRDGKAITLSQDALLVALVSTAQAVRDAAEAKGLTSEQGAVAMEVDTSPEEAVSVALQASPEGEVRLQISPSQGPQGPRQGHASGPWATQQHHRGDLSFLDPVNTADCPPTAVRLAAGELVLRIREEQRRRAIGNICAASMQTRRMTSNKPGAKDEAGLHINTEETDCEVCKCDLWLNAIISPACPGKATCSEHAAALPCAKEEQILLYRHSLEELQQLVDSAVRCIEGTQETIDSAIRRKTDPPLKTKAVPLGPLTGLAALRKGRASAAPAVEGGAQGPAEGQAAGVAGLATPAEPQQEQPQSPVAAGVLQRIKQESPRGMPALHMQTAQPEASDASPMWLGGSPIRSPAKSWFNSPPLSPSKVAAQDAAAAAALAATAAAARAADALSTAAKLRSPRSAGPASPGAAQTVSFEQAPDLMQAPAHAEQHQVQALAEQQQQQQAAEQHQAQVLAKQQQQQQVGMDPAVLQQLLAMGQLRPLVGNPGAMLSLLSLPQAQQAAVQGLPGLLPGLQPALALQSVSGQQSGLALPGHSMSGNVLESQGRMGLNWQDRLQQQQQLLVNSAGLAPGPQQLVPASLAAFTGGMPLNLNPQSFQQHLTGFSSAEQQPGAGQLH
eukprot:jgi/Astpho2/5677/Aster-02919